MKSMKEKDLLRDIMEDIFIPLYDHTEKEYKKIEKRVMDEMPLIANSYVIWNTLMQRESANGGSPYMFPMVEEDLQMPEIEVADINNRLLNEKEIRLDSIFIEADYLICKEIETNREVFDGKLKTESNEYPISIRLRQSSRYSKTSCTTK
jgi:hypothetical protein